MNTASTHIHLPPFAKILAMVFSLSTTAFAQQLLAPLDTPAPVAAKEASRADSSLQATSAFSAGSSGFRAGPFVLHPYASYRYLYIDGVRSASGTTKDTIIQTTSVGVQADLGTHLDFNYSAAWSIYSKSDFRDNVSHSISGNWSTSYQEWDLGANHSSTFSDSTELETGRQTEQSSHSTGFNAAYALNSRYALTTALNQNLRIVEDFDDVSTWSITEMLSQKTTYEITTSVGLEYSYTAIDKAADMTSLQYIASVAWQLTSVLNASAQFALESRRIHNTPAQTTTTPVYSGRLQYQPFSTTQLSASVSRSTGAGYFRNQLTESDTYRLSFSQRLLKRFRFSANYSHGESTFTSTTPPLTVVREDKSDSIGLTLGTAFFQRLSASLGYQYTKNESDLSAFKVNSSQYSVEVGYSF